MLYLWEEYSWCVGAILGVWIFLWIWILGFFIRDYYKIASEYNNYHECIDSYYRNKEWVKNEIDDIMDNIKLQLSPYIAAWLESDFYNQIESIESFAQNHPQSKFRRNLKNSLYDHFWWISIGSSWPMIGLEYQIENQKKLEPASQYLTSELKRIYEEYPCHQPEKSRTDSYVAYEKFCERELRIEDELDKNSICNNNITNRREYKNFIKEREDRREEYNKKEEERRQTVKVNTPKCIQKYW